VRAADASTGFTPETDSDFSSWSAGRRSCVGLLATLQLEPRQDLARQLGALAFSALRARDVLVLEVPLLAGAFFALALRPRAKRAAGGLAGAGAAAPALGAAAAHELVSEEQCQVLGCRAATVRAFYQPASQVQLAAALRLAETPAAALPAVALDQLELLREHADLADRACLGGALRDFALAAARLQAGGASAAARRPAPPRFSLHVTDSPDVCANFRTAHLSAPEGGRVTLRAVLALPPGLGAGPLAFGGGAGYPELIKTALPAAVDALLALADRIAELDPLPAGVREAARAGRKRLTDEMAESKREGKESEAERAARRAPLTPKQLEEERERAAKSERRRQMRQQRSAQRSGKPLGPLPT
jgi:hypothetical protein